MALTVEEKIEKIKELRPIDDVLFEVLAEDREVCEEMLRVILEDDKLIVHDVITQSDQRNIYGRSVRLDALCTLGDGSKCNIEVQRSDNDDHLKRVRFNAASITVKDSNPGERFEKVIELKVVYISEFDVFRKSKTIYHVDKILRETGDVVDDGLHEIFVNAAINDGSNIAELMQSFKQQMVDNPKFPKLSDRMRLLKETQGGASAVCTVMEKYEKIAAEEAVKKERLSSVRNLLNKGCSKSFILSLNYSEDEYNKAEKELLNS